MLALILALVVGVASVADVPSPRPIGWVTDQANVLDAATHAKLDAIAGELNRTHGVELAIVTVDSVPGTSKQFSTALFNAWHLGSAQRNTGVLVLLVMKQHRLEVETGTGIEVSLSSQWLADMQAREMVPRFKHKDFPGGLVAGAQAIADHLSAGETATPGSNGEYRNNGAIAPPTGSAGSDAVASTSASPNAPPPTVAPVAAGDLNGHSGASAYAFAGIVFGGAVVLVWLVLGSRRRARSCRTCVPRRRMLALDEVADDAYLQPGQRVEEHIGSVDYEVLVCPGCQLTRTLRHGKWFSSWGTCTACSFKAARSSSITMVEATYVNGGQIRVITSCANCQYTTSYVRTTPARTPPSTSSSYSSSSSSYSSSSSDSSSASSSSDSGYSGGSSSGGGAGSDW